MGVKASIINEVNIEKDVVLSLDILPYIQMINIGLIKECKPYLFPLSSITEEQKKELQELHFDYISDEIVNDIEFVYHYDCTNLIDWLNKNHFDYRELIDTFDKLINHYKNLIKEL